jgi:hypothetical protein
VPFKRANDGSFFMPVENFKRAFFVMSVHYVKDGWENSYYEATAARDASYSFDVKRPMDAFI